MTEPLAQRMAALTALSTAALRSEWQRVFHNHPPQRMGRDLLVRAVAYTMQEQAYGGLSQATRRRLRLLAQQLEQKGRVSPPSSPVLRPGVRLVREWNRDTHEVLVLESGFDYRGTRYRSLTEIAKHITGTNWSGPRFFGLTRPKPERPRRVSPVSPRSMGPETANASPS